MPHARPIAAASPVAATLLALVLPGLAGCARDGRDWRSAQDADTTEAYAAFVARHPQSEFAPKAKERAGQLAEERDWSVATQADTPEAYRTFVGQHPDGKWTQEARIRVENFNVMAASAPEVPVAPVAAGPRAAVAQPAASRVTSTATSVEPPGPGRAAAPGDHRVQLGAFSTVGKAEAEWVRVRERFAPLQTLEPSISAAQTAAGRLFRLQTVVPDETGAKALCDTLKVGGQACLYVPPK